MFGAGVGIRVFPEVCEGPHGLVGSFELVVHIKIVSEVKGYVGLEVLNVFAKIYGPVGRVGSVRDW